MSRTNRRPLADRVATAAEAALAAQGYVSAVDLLTEIGWLYPDAAKIWQQGRIDCLEEAMQVGADRILDALALLRAWAVQQGLVAHEASHVDRTPERRELRFSRSGDPEVERTYRIHWISPALSEAKRARVTEKASRAPELVVIAPLNDDWKCHRCGGSGGLLMMEKPGPACLRCVDLDDLAYLPAGDALLTRRTRARSARHAVVVRFSRSRKRYERQGLLVEPQALDQAQSELKAERHG